MAKKLSIFEFNKLVEEYNKYFEKGVSNPSLSESYTNPIYERKDLTPEQKDAIMIASDWRRIRSGWNI